MSGDFVKGALVGGILGGIAALLAAPKSGKELINDLTETVTDTYHSFRDQDEESTLSKHKGTILTGTSLGILAGAALAALLAPQSGKKLRRNLSDRAEELLSSVRDNKKISSTLDEVSHWADLGLSVLQNLRNKRRG